MKKSKRCCNLVIGSLIVVLIALCVTCYLLTEEELKMKQLSSKIGANFTPEDTVDGIKIEFRVMSVDLAKNKLESHLTLIPSNGLTTKYNQLSKDLLFNFNYYQKEFKANSTLSSIEITYPILEGSTSYYPFDKFSTLIEVEIINLEDQTAVPIQLNLKASIPSLKFSFNPIDDGNQHQKVILNIERPGTIVFFSLFLFIVMWTLSLAVFMLALWTIAFSEERPGASYLGLGSALLFALPNLRSTQPGVPPIGALLDTIGFFWNMVLVAVSSSIMIGVWIHRFNHSSSS